MAEVRVTGTADEIELTARSLGAAPRIQRRRDGMMAGYFEVHAPKVICLDLGTTGPNPVEDEIAAIAIVGWAGNVLHEGKYRPSRKELWKAASEVNGVSPDDQIDLPSFFDDQAKIRDIICGADEVIVYNAPRVMRFLEYNDAASSSAPESPIQCTSIATVSQKRTATPIASRTASWQTPRFESDMPGKPVRTVP